MMATITEYVGDQLMAASTSGRYMCGEVCEGTYARGWCKNGGVCGGGGGVMREGQRVMC